MSKIVVFGDPHFGLRRQANTTPASQLAMAKMQQAQFEVICTLGDQLICVGDLFDRYSNDEATIAQGIAAMQSIDWCLAGNHDVVQAAERTGSLELLQEVVEDGDQRILYAGFGEWGFEVHVTDDVMFWGVPHVCRQDLFEESLVAAVRDAGDTRNAPGLPKVLLLHANYDLPWELNDTTLNVTHEMADSLLETFDYVITGHDHQAKEDFDGRYIVVGNPMPTTFGEIGDKRVIVFEDGVPRSQTIWHADPNYVEIAANAIPEALDAEFVEITGRVPAAELAATTNKALTLWKTSPNLLALKLSFVSAMTSVTSEADTTAAIERLPERISNELDESLRPLWQEMLGRLNKDET